MTSLSFITYILLACILVISYIAFGKTEWLEKGRHYPFLEHRDRSFYRWLSCTFLHANMAHLLLNAFVLFQFGSAVEHKYQIKFGAMAGSLIYLLIYLSIAVLSSIPTYLKHKENPNYASVGASGVISGLLFIYILYYPSSMLGVYFVIPMPAWLFGFLYLAYSWYAEEKLHDNIDHAAHYYGAVMGILIGILVDPQVINKFL
ncbi:MAG TPA: rhomboid family intramembrane serine protease [Saprospiraceae bacterium]|nr:rhomboid family intramembrane serine protease [Saprospiraceae bacterium]